MKSITNTKDLHILGFNDADGTSTHSKDFFITDRRE
jgi:hypothetical protein